jgi:hypothetical protein
MNHHEYLFKKGEEKGIKKSEHKKPLHFAKTKLVQNACNIP